MDFPGDLQYTREHQWVRDLGDGTLRLGLTSYAQRALGEVVFVNLPTVGTALRLSESLGEVESTSGVIDVYAPVVGRVAARNQALQATPELVNSDPYGEGWLVEITREAGEVSAELLTARQYAELVGSS